MASKKKYPSPRYTLGGSLQEYARQCMQDAKSPQHARLIYLNLLAVQAVECYLQEIELEVERECSSSFNPAARAIGNVADLATVGFGTLECRPVMPDQQVAILPFEELRPRVGTMLVEIVEADRCLRILGFTGSRVAKTKTPMREVGPFVPRTKLEGPQFLKPYLISLQFQKGSSQVPNPEIAHSDNVALSPNSASSGKPAISAVPALG
ncbi:MAG: DUF1822 family protein [Cyanobacteria bacterium J06641_5]